MVASTTNATLLTLWPRKTLVYPADRFLIQWELDYANGTARRGGLSEPPKLMDRVRGKLRVLHLSKRTEEAYVGWIVRFISVHRDPAGRWVHLENMTGAEVSEFLTHLAVVREVSASTQNQSLSALLFLYTKVLGDNQMGGEPNGEEPNGDTPL